MLNVDDKITLTPHFRIETSLNEGIKYLLQSSSTQIVAVDSFKTLKFYEFIDKQVKEEQEKKAALEDEISKHIKEILHKYDVDQNGMLNFPEAKKFFDDWFEWAGYGWAKDIWDESVFRDFDADGSGMISKFELKNAATRMIDQGYAVPKK